MLQKKEKTILFQFSGRVIVKNKADSATTSFPGRGFTSIYFVLTNHYAFDHCHHGALIRSFTFDIRATEIIVKITSLCTVAAVQVPVEEGKQNRILKTACGPWNSSHDKKTELSDLRRDNQRLKAQVQLRLLLLLLPRSRCRSDQSERPALGRRAHRNKDHRKGRLK